MHTIPLDLVLDVGNTRTKVGLFRGRRLLRAGVMRSGDDGALKEFMSGDRPDRIALGSVAAPDPNWEVHLRTIAPTFLLTGGSSAPLSSTYATPLTLGVDRLANAVGAKAMFPGRPVLAIDLGTCVTYDVVSADGVYQGGAISPGMTMRSRAMNDHSARLPLVAPADDTALIGVDTKTSLASGVHFGIVHEIQGYIHHLAHQYPGMAVVLTGGDGLRFARALKSGIFAHPFLTLEGLHAILLHQGH
ncbi:MAG: type III pantothenate kinase [Flavobacteriales bacterium]|nr:type III pantothenate kinase [Flavobacteriales bacterium]